MNFNPASGYEAALGVLGHVYIPTRDKNEAQPPNFPLSAATHGQTPATVMSYSPSNPSIRAAGSSAATASVQTLSNHNLLPSHDKALLNRPLYASSSSIQNSPHRSNDSTTSIPLPSHRVGSRDISTSHGRLEGQIQQRSEPLFTDNISKTGFASRLPHNPLDRITPCNVAMGPPEERPRPLTSPLRYQLHDTLTELHPPKRILPFPEVMPKSVRADPIEDGPMGDVPQPEPTSASSEAAKKGGKEKTKAQKSKKPGSTSAKLASAVSSSGPIPTIVKTAKLAASSAPNPSSKTSRTTKAKEPSSRSNRKASPIVESDIAESSDRPPSPKSRMLSMDKRSTATKTKETASAALTDTYMETVDAFVRKHAPRPAPLAPNPAPVSDLESYAGMPKSRRLESLDELIIKCIEDDNFVTICEDVEKSWKRVGLNVLTFPEHQEAR